MNWHLHQQTGFPASTVTDDDEFAADFSHLNHKAQVSECEICFGEAAARVAPTAAVTL